MAPLMPLDPDGEALPDGHRCPDCGGPIERLHRHALDRWASSFRSLHRYRCLDDKCGWEGLMGRVPHTVPPATARLPWAGRLAWLALGATVATAAALGPRAFQRAQGAAPAVQAASSASAYAQARLAAPGLDVEGPALAPTDTRVTTNTSPLTLRRHCAWGTPGTNRYRGTVSQALSAARLPPEVVQQIAALADRGEAPEEVLITRDRVRTVDGRRSYSPKLRAMGFGNSLCFDTQVNFPPGHVEQGALYEVKDKRGRTHTVMVPYVCNNVAVLGEEADEDVPPGPPPPVPPPRRVPEPSAWSLALLALCVMAFLHGLRRRSREGPNGRRQGTPAPSSASHAHLRPPPGPGHHPARERGRGDRPAGAGEQRSLRGTADGAGQ